MGKEDETIHCRKFGEHFSFLNFFAQAKGVRSIINPTKVDVIKFVVASFSLSFIFCFFFWCI